MTEAKAPPTVAQLEEELQRLFESGLAYLDLNSVPHLSYLAVATRYAQPTTLTALSIQRLLAAAVGLLDDDKLQTPVAYLFGLGSGMDVTASKSERLEAALARYGGGERAFRNHRPEEVRRLADAALQIYNDQTRAARLPESLRPIAPDAPRAVSNYMRRESAQEWLALRQEQSNARWRNLIKRRDELQETLGPLPSNLCMFASGSFGREEAMEHSDLDMFLIDDYRGDQPSVPQRSTKFEIARAIALIDRVRELQDIQRFSQAGYYQEPQSFHDMLPRADDGNARELSRSTTALALLIANSKCFWNQELYDRLRGVALDYYWRDLDVSRRDTDISAERSTTALVDHACRFRAILPEDGVER